MYYSNKQSLFLRLRNTFSYLSLAVLMSYTTSAFAYTVENGKENYGVNIMLDEVTVSTLSKNQQRLLKSTLVDVTKRSRDLLIDMPTRIDINVTITDKELNDFRGVSGIAQTPTTINLSLSKHYEKGIENAIEVGVRNTLFHEYHHIAHGWTVEGNHHGPGIATAAVNEGLATVFADHYSDNNSLWLDKGKAQTDWIQEIIRLPDNAPYDVWMMGTHPDGRQYIGYKVGVAIVNTAMDKSGMSILEIGKLSPFEVLHLSGYIDTHAKSLSKLGDHFAKLESTDKAIATYQKALSVIDVDDEISKARLQKRIKLLKDPIYIPEKTLNHFVGTYSFEGLSVQVALSQPGNELSIQLPGKPKFKLHPDTPTSFFIYEADANFDFIGETSSVANKLIVNLMGREMVLSREM